MFGFKKKKENVVGNVVRKEPMQSVQTSIYGLHTLFQNTILLLKDGVSTIPESIVVERRHTLITIAGEVYNSVDILDEGNAFIFGHPCNIYDVEAFRNYFEISERVRLFRGVKMTNGEAQKINNVSWRGQLVPGTEVFFMDANYVQYKTHVFAVEFSSENFVVFTTNPEGTKRYFCFR